MDEFMRKRISYYDVMQSEKKSNTRNNFFFKEIKFINSI